MRKNHRLTRTSYPSLHCVIVTHLQDKLLFLGEDCVVPLWAHGSSWNILGYGASWSGRTVSYDVATTKFNCLVGFWRLLTTILKSLMGGAVRTTVNRQNQSCRLYLQDCHREPWEGTSYAASSKAYARTCVGTHTHRELIQAFLLKGTSASGIWCS